jgi:hypothetical protein
MTLRTSLITAVVGSALALGVPAAFGQAQPAVQSPDAVEQAVLARELSSRIDAKVYRDAFERAVAANRQGAGAVGSYVDAHNRSSGSLSTSAVPTDAFERAVLSGRTTGFVGDSHDRIAPESPTPGPVTSSGRDLEWPQIGIGFGVGILLALALGMAMRLTRIRQLAH